MTTISFPRYNQLAFNIDSVADLRDIPVAAILDGMLTFVAGQTNLDDGQGGVYVWASESEEADDDLDVVAPEGLAQGRWLRILSNNVGHASGMYFTPAGTGGVDRTIQSKVRERISVLDYGADPTGVTLSDAAFLAAKNAAQSASGGGTIYVPQGTYLVSDLPLLNATGIRIVGDSRYTSKLKIQAGATGSILYNTGPSTSGLHHISDLFFDLSAINVTAIDLSSVNNTVVERVRIVGGTSLGTATGVGVLCAAPADTGSYTNRIANCDGTYLARGFVAEDAGNENAFENCEAIVCTIGFDIENSVDTATIRGGRAEGCGTGLRTGGRETIVMGVRFEANSTADVAFVAGSDRPSFLSCYTATSATVFLNEQNTTGLFSRGGTFPQRDYEPNTSNPIIHAGRATFGAASSAATFRSDLAQTTPGVSNYSAYFYDAPMLKNGVGMESINGTNDNSVLVFNVDSSNRVNIAAYDRKAGAYRRIYLGEVLSVTSTGLEYSGVKVVGAQQAAIANDASGAANQATVNAILAAMRTHGLIAT